MVSWCDTLHLARRRHAEQVTCEGKTMEFPSQKCLVRVLVAIFYFPIYWEQSSQLTFIFFRGVAQPPTRCGFSCFFVPTNPLIYFWTSWVFNQWTRTSPILDEVVCPNIQDMATSYNISARPTETNTKIEAIVVLCGVHIYAEENKTLCSFLFLRVAPCHGKTSDRRFCCGSTATKQRYVERNI